MYDFDNILIYTYLKKLKSVIIHYRILLSYSYYITVRMHYAYMRIENQTEEV